MSTSLKFRNNTIATLVLLFTPLFVFSQNSIEEISDGGTMETMLNIALEKCTKDSIENAENILLQSPEDKLTMLRSIDLLIEQKSFAESHRLVDLGLDYYKNDLDFLYKKALLFELERKYDDALKFYQIRLKILTGDDKVKDANVERMEAKLLKNQVNLSYLYIDHDDLLYASSIATLEYIRKEGSNTFVGRLNTTSRHSEMGYQGELDWYHVFNNSSYFLLNIGFADQFFPKLKGGLSYYQPIKNAWVAEFGTKYYYNYIDKDSQIFGVLGLEKEISNFWLNAKYTIGTEKDFRSHLFLQSRMFMKDEKSYATLMAGYGNMPEANDLNYLAQNQYSIKNMMIGGGYTHYFSDRINLKLVVNWYQYQINENEHSNQYHGFISVGYLF